MDGWMDGCTGGWQGANSANRAAGPYHEREACHVGTQSSIPCSLVCLVFLLHRPLVSVHAAARCLLIGELMAALIWVDTRPTRTSIGYSSCWSPVWVANCSPYYARKPSLMKTLLDSMPHASVGFTLSSSPFVSPACLLCCIPYFYLPVDATRCGDSMCVRVHALEEHYLPRSQTREFAAR